MKSIKNIFILIFTFVFFNTFLNAAKISRDMAVEIVLKNSKDAIIKSIEFEGYKKNPIWEIEIWDKEGTKEYKVDANNGRVMLTSIEYDDLYENPVKNPKIKMNNKKMLSEKEIFDIVKKDIPNGKITKISLKNKYGTTIFEVDVIINNDDVEYKIDAYSGEILEVDY